MLKSPLHGSDVQGTQPVTRVTLPPEVREVLITAIADALVADYRRRHELDSVPRRKRARESRRRPYHDRNLET
jgi:hypothetical protein